MADEQQLLAKEEASEDTISELAEEEASEDEQQLLVEGEASEAVFSELAEEEELGVEEETGAVKEQEE